MRTWLVALVPLPFALTGCPALLSDWDLAEGAGGDAGPGVAGKSGFGAGGNRGSPKLAGGSPTSDSSGGSLVALGGLTGTGGAPNGGNVSGGGGTSTGGSTTSGGVTSSGTGGTTSTSGTGGSAPVCESLQGPSALSLTNAGAIGITFHSKIDATLAKFVFHNGGYADTVSLQDGASCSIVASVTIPAHVQSYTATVSWQLVANKSYRLVSTATGQYNETQAIVSPGSWPWTNGQSLIVDDCAGGVDHCSSDASSGTCGWSHQYWFNFTDLELCE